MDGHNAPHSPHARVRVINVSQYDANMKTKEQLLMSDEGCTTPKKKPAKIINIFKKDPSSKDEKKASASLPSSAIVAKAAAKVASKDLMPIPMPNTNEEALNDFLNRVAISQQKDANANKKCPSTHGQMKQPQQQPPQHQHQNPQQNPGIVSPQRRNYLSMLPDYARYHETRIQRALSRGNSFSNLSPTSPGVEWVDHRSAPPSVQWDPNGMARHSYPANIFCTPGDAHSPVQAATMAAMHQEYGYPHYPSPHHSCPPSPAAMSDMAYHHEYHHVHRRSYPMEGGSVPSAAAISRGSSSSWSEDEERHYMDYMAHGGLASYASRHHHQQFLQHQQHPATAAAAAAAATASEDSQDLPLVEISPGVHEPLRKADETVQAVRHDFYVPVSCFGCSSDIFSIADAKYVICPTCRVVSPIEEGALDGQVLRQHGLGLGFTTESLFQIQSDILLER